MNKKKVLQDNPLDENDAMDAMYGGPIVKKGITKEKSSNIQATNAKRVSSEKNKRKKPGRPASFNNGQELYKITAHVPKELFVDFNVMVAKKTSRFNLELSKAMESYLKYKKL